MRVAMCRQDAARLHPAGQFRSAAFHVWKNALCRPRMPQGSGTWFSAYWATKSMSAYAKAPDLESLRSVILTAASLELPLSASKVRLL